MREPKEGGTAVLSQCRATEEQCEQRILRCTRSMGKACVNASTRSRCSHFEALDSAWCIAVNHRDKIH